MHVVVNRGHKKRIAWYAGFAVVVAFVFGISLVTVPGVQAMDVPITTEYKLPSGGQTHDIVNGPDGNLWLTGGLGVARIVPSTGAVTEYDAMNDWGITGNSALVSITPGPDGNLWVTHYDTFLGTSSLLKISTSGVLLNQYFLPNGATQPYDVVAGPDGNMWYTGYSTNVVGKMTTSGAVTEYTVPTANTGPHHITLGGDGNLWFTGWTNNTGNSINKITPAGVVTRYASLSSNSRPFDITLGPDGNVWYTMVSTSEIGRITPSGTITEFDVGFSGTRGIIEGHDGNMWFMGDTDRIGYIDLTTEAITTVDDDDIEDDPFSMGYSIAAASDGNMWFTDSSAYSVFRYSTAQRFPVDTGYTFTDITTGGPQAGVTWRSVDTDKTGQKVIATDNNDVFVSNDGGTTWVNVSDGTAIDTSYFQDVAISADGSTLVVGGTPDGVFTSTDGGTTWTNTMLGEGIPQGNWYSVDVNEDGTKMVAALIGSDVYVTSDAGGTWTNATSVTPGTGRPWSGVMISEDASTIAIGSFNSDILISHDLGTTWYDAAAAPGSVLPPWSAWGTIAATPDGQTLVLGNEYGGDIYKSTDAGLTWANLTSGNAESGQSWKGIDITDDGQHIIAIDDTGSIHVSHDGGATFANAVKYSSMTGQSWTAAALSGDGSVGYIADGNGAMYRAYNALLVAAAPGGGSGGGAGGSGAGSAAGVPNTGVAPMAPFANIMFIVAGAGVVAAIAAAGRLVYVTQKRR